MWCQLSTDIRECQNVSNNVQKFQKVSTNIKVCQKVKKVSKSAKSVKKCHRTTKACQLMSKRKHIRALMHLSLDCAGLCYSEDYKLSSYFIQITMRAHNATRLSIVSNFLTCTKWLVSSHLCVADWFDNSHRESSDVLFLHLFF